MARWIAVLSLAALCLGGLARAEEEDAPPKQMTIGDPAPDIDITHWVKGVEMDRRGDFTPITSFGDGKVYVLEFWATWCGPCVAGMPHLSELQEKHRQDGVTIIGVSDESLPKVASFLFQEDRRDGRLQNDRTHYILTTDPDQSVKRDYFLAAGQSGIPCAFIIGKDGHVEWIGHPIRMDEPLAAVVADTWDRDAFKAEFEEEQAYKRMMREARDRMNVAVKDGDWAAYVAILDELLAMRPGDARLLWTKFQTLLTKANDPEAGYAMGAQLLEANWESQQMLNQIAWMVVDDKLVVKRDLDFALKAAERANELAKSEDAAVLDTLARVHHDRGDLEAALVWQRKAVEQAGDDPMGAGIRDVLEAYETEAASKTD
jgi:thiol-disulfide isomerase/thioredoxin